MAVKKLSPKEVAESAHTLAICSYIIVEHLDDVTQHEHSEKIKEAFGIVTRFCEGINEDVFDIKEIYSGTYIQEMTNKIETVIRKNANFIH